MTRVFFTDRDLGKRFPGILVAAGLSIERHDERFRPNASDEEWLEYAGKHDRIAITHDGRIRYKPNELAAVIRHRVRLLVVIGAAPYPELARQFVDTLPRIESFLEAHAAPFIAKVYRPKRGEAAQRADAPGSVSLWYPPQS